MKSELLHTILSVVSDICEINENEICSHVKRSDVVDARVLFIYYCHKYGFPPASVAKYVGRARTSCVTDALYNYKIFSRQSAAFRYLCTEIGKKLADIFPVESM